MQVTLHEDIFNTGVHRELGPINTDATADGGRIEELVRDLDFTRLEPKLPGEPVADPVVRRVDVDGHMLTWSEPGTEPPPLLSQLWRLVESDGEWRDVAPGP